MSDSLIITTHECGTQSRLSVCLSVCLCVSDIWLAVGCTNKLLINCHKNIPVCTANKHSFIYFGEYTQRKHGIPHSTMKNNCNVIECCNNTHHRVPRTGKQMGTCASGLGDTSHVACWIIARALCWCILHAQFVVLVCWQKWTLHISCSVISRWNTGMCRDSAESLRICTRLMTVSS